MDVVLKLFALALVFSSGINFERTKICSEAGIYNTLTSCEGVTYPKE